MIRMKLNAKRKYAIKFALKIVGITLFLTIITGYFSVIEENFYWISVYEFMLVLSLPGSFLGFLVSYYMDGAINYYVAWGVINFVFYYLIGLKRFNYLQNKKTK